MIGNIIPIRQIITVINIKMLSAKNLSSAFIKKFKSTFGTTLSIVSF